MKNYNKKTEKSSRWKLACQYLHSLRSYDAVNQRSKLISPLFVQVQTVDSCNASCVTCPFAMQKRKKPPAYMDNKLYIKILKELKELGSLKVFSPMLQSEPLLDPGIVDRIKQAKETLGPEVAIGIVTNGSLLTSQMARSLVDAGIDRIEVSIDAFDKPTFNKIRPGLSFAKVVANTKNILVENPQIDLVTRFLCQSENKGQEAKFKQYWQSLGAAVMFTPVVNRAGFLPNFDKVSRRHRTFSLKKLKNWLWRSVVRCCVGVREPVQCVLPFSWFYILIDGRVALCCHDWGPIDIVGDLREQTIAEIWNGEQLNHYRHLLWSGKPNKSLVCKNCSVVNGTNIGA